MFLTRPVEWTLKPASGWTMSWLLTRPRSAVVLFVGFTEAVKYDVGELKERRKTDRPV